MKQKILFLLVCLGIFTFSSCIKDEALNNEADITACKITDNSLIRDPVITNDKVTLYVKDSVDITKQSPEFARSLMVLRFHRQVEASTIFPPHNNIQLLHRMENGINHIR
jgi:hypothetical protein